MSSSPASLVDVEAQSVSFEMNVKIDVKDQLFPYCIVWTPIPFLTWLLPFIGHMGICNSGGIIYDFAGPYYIGERELAFGRPTKYWQLNPMKADGGSVGWDKAISEGCTIYRGRTHNLILDNCHSHVAKCLNIMKYKGRSSWNMIWLAVMMLICGKYISFVSFLKTWVPFLIFLSIILTLAYAF